MAGQEHARSLTESPLGTRANLSARSAFAALLRRNAGRAGLPFLLAYCGIWFIAGMALQVTRTFFL